MLGIFPVKAIEKERVIAKSSKIRNGPMGFDELQIPTDTFVRYLLDFSELEEGKRRITDMNWSPQIYLICESIVQKNQPILYWLIDDVGNGPERSFVREELQIIPLDIELPSQ